MRLRYVLSELGIGLRQNLSMVVAVILVSFVSLAAVGSAGLLQLQIGKMTDEWYGKIEVSVWMCAESANPASCPDGEATKDQIDAVEKQLKSGDLAPYIKSYQIESPQDAFKSFQKKFGEEDWAKNTTVDAFGPIFRVSLNNAEDYRIIAEAIDGRPGVDEVLDQNDLLDQLFSILNKLTIIALGMAGVMIIAAVLLITTTIRLSALSRRRETGIMRLVGASNLFIYLPFMLEGVVAALIGSVLAVGTLWAVVQFWLPDIISTSFRMLGSPINAGDVLLYAPLLVGVAVLLAAFASILTLRRFTRV